MKPDDSRPQEGGGRSPATHAQQPPSVAVLVVDDDESIRKSLHFALTGEGYDVLEAIDGVAALTLLRSARRKLVVLLDHIMPGVDGATVLRQVATERALAQRHAYVLMTASAHVAHLEEDLKTLPFTLVIMRKPFELEALFSTVREAHQRLTTS